MQLQLYNTLTKSKVPFKPVDKNKIKIYVCGPTVYDYPHLGNALAVVIYDVLFRLVNYIYGSDKVIYARNITDVDDKIITAALAQNITITELSQKITKIFQDNMNQLNCLSPTFEPKATEHIKEMIEVIDKLLENGYAYKSNGDVYFRVAKFAKYGELSGRNLEDLIAGSRVEINENKENSEDFALWKASDDVSCSFNSPYGIGRPGWHIECSAMSKKYLGDDFDIHGGGIDLVFPHHTNEIAQSCCAHPGSKYAHHWMHNGFLTVNGEKMSKSLGNFITIEELLKKGIHGEVIRYVLLSSHYRKPIDWNEKSLHDAQKALDGFYRILQQGDISDIEPPKEFLETLLDDLNTPQSFALLHEYATSYNKTKDPTMAMKLKSSGRLLGFFINNTSDWFTNNNNISPKYIEEQIAKRLVAKANKNWKIADKIRDDLKAQNIVLEDTPNGGCNWRQG